VSAEGGFLAHLTAREVILQTAAMLEEQGCYSYDSDVEACRYRASDGSKCAVGLWLTDKQAALIGEAGSWDTRVAGSIDGFDGPHTDVLRQLQEIHDDGALWGYPLKVCLENMRLFADREYPEEANGGTI
jgi:hypothetical protein